jgi:hypothetical protein
MGATEEPKDKTNVIGCKLKSQAILKNGSERKHPSNTGTRE